MLNHLRQLLRGALAFFQVRPQSKADERRRLIRLRCDYKVQCVAEQLQFSAQIKDMGLNGMRLTMNEKLQPGSSIFVYHPSQTQRTENEHVLCLVRWSRRPHNGTGFDVGLQYADTPGNMRRSWVKFLLKELGFDERAIYTRRKSIRANSSIDGMLKYDGQDFPGIILNLGAGGALLETDTNFAANIKVQLKIGPLAGLKPICLPGVVLNCKEGEDSTYVASIRFLDLKPAQVRNLGQFVLQLLRSSSA